MLADLSWSEGGDPLFLVLRMRVSRYMNALPLHDVGITLPPRHRWDVSPTRLAKLHIQNRDSGSSGDCAPLTPTPTWKLLYLQTRSYREPESSVYFSFNHTFPPVFRLPEHHFANFLRPRKGWKIKNAQLPWLGTPPLLITFPYHTAFDSLYMAVQFGRCDTRTQTSTGSVDSLASIWANFRRSTSTADCGDQDHECPTDHILSWPNLERTFVLLTHHIQGSPVGERDMKWMLKMSFSQTSVGTGPLSLTHISIKHRILMKRLGYHDFTEAAEAEEREKNLRNAQASALLDKDHPEQKQHANFYTMGQDPVSDRQVYHNEVHELSKKSLVHLYRRILRFLIRSTDQSSVLPKLCLWRADRLSPCLDSHLYEFHVYPGVDPAIYASWLVV